MSIEAELISKVSNSVLNENLFNEKSKVGDILQKELDRLLKAKCVVWHSIQGFNVFYDDRKFVEVKIETTVH